MTVEDYRQLDLPDKPGVYRFIDEENQLLYVGKAKNLKKRVSSYFLKKKYDYYRIKVLVQKADRLEFTIVETEQDALLLENSIIKEFQPKYNIQLKDDKTYPYICIKKERFPRVFLTRKIINDGSEYLGPYTSVRKVKTILDLLKQLFPIRTCNFKLTEENINKGKFKVCLEFHMGNCLGPCEGLQSEEQYNANMAQLRHILKGNFSDVIQYLKEAMKAFAEKYEFEKANEFKYKLELLQQYQSKSTIVNPKLNNIEVYAMASDDVRYYINCFRIANGSIIQTKLVELTAKLNETKEEILSYGILKLRELLKSNYKDLIVPFEVVLSDTELRQAIPQRGDKLKLLELAQKNVQYYRNQQILKYAETSRNKKGMEVVAQIKSDFRLKELPFHIECFDNSNFQGAFPVASMVVFKNGKPSKQEYRHFNIKTVEGPDDYASMEEVVYRRYKRLVEEGESLPQLIIIDGGKGQLNAGKKALEKLEIYGQIAIAGIAKRLEEIFVPDDPYPLLISKKSPSLKVIQQIRNEAHRFAISFHRKKRSTGALKSELSDIEGIGPKSIEKLYQHFKSFKAIKNADLDELGKVINKTQAAKLKAHFEKS